MENQSYKIDPGKDSTAKEYARRFILNHFQTMFSHIEGIIENKDPEHIHQFRVSGRRLRAVLKTFGSIFPKKETKVFISVIKELTTLTGKARDLDVSILFLKDYIIDLPETDLKTIQTYLNEKQAERNRLQPVIVDVLNSFLYSDFTYKFNRFFNRIQADVNMDE